MKRGILYTFIAVLLSVMASCDGMDATYSEFIKDGPIVYIGKADSLKAFSGKNRIKLSWQMQNDPRGVKATIFWKDKTQSATLDLNRSEKIVEYTIEDLPEASYVFNVVVYDKYGNSSLDAEITGEVYGDVYMSYLNPRSYTKKSGKAIYYNNDTKKWEMILNAIRDKTLINTELVYIDKNGEEKTLSWTERGAYTYTLEGYAEGGVVKYRSCFEPQDSAIDKFWTDYVYLVAAQ